MTMTWQMEQWGIIICIIWPIGFYLMLGLINYVDNNRTANWRCDEDNPYWCEVCGFTWCEEDPLADDAIDSEHCPYH